MIVRLPRNLEQALLRLLAQHLSPKAEPSHDELLRTRFDRRSDEIQWRGIQRDVIAGLAITVLLGTLVAGGVYALGAPLLFFYLAVRWEQHDRRMGSAAAYIRDVLEPKMRTMDGVESYEPFLDRTEPSRSHNQRFTLSGVTNRAFFPLLQAITTIIGLARIVTGPYHGAIIVTVVAVIVLINIGIIALTASKVRHHRVAPSNRQASS